MIKRRIHKKTPWIATLLDFSRFAAFSNCTVPLAVAVAAAATGALLELAFDVNSFAGCATSSWLLLIVELVVVFASSMLTACLTPSLVLMLPPESPALLGVLGMDFFATKFPEYLAIFVSILCTVQYSMPMITAASTIHTQTGKTVQTIA